MANTWNYDPNLIDSFSRLIPQCWERLKLNKVSFSPDGKYIFSSDECALVVDLIKSSVRILLSHCSQDSQINGGENSRFKALLHAAREAIDYSVPPEYHHLVVIIEGSANG
jgi:hypothetical protein